MEQIDPVADSEKHIRYLDSARGIAAMLVVALHFMEHKWHGQPKCSWWSMLFNGKDAVSFFFVLSGFVLSYKIIVLNKPLDIRKYLVSRIFRLWPAYFLAVTIYCMYALYRNHSFEHDKLQTIIDIFIFNKYHFWEEALIFRFHNDYYGPGWTLTIEMGSSFLLPFFINLALQNRKYVLYGIFVLAVIYGNFMAFEHFLLGLYICTYYTKINQEFFQQQKWYKFRYLILLLAIILWPIRYIDELHPFPALYNTIISNYINIKMGEYTAISSGIFLVAIIYYKQAQRFLENRVLVFIGKISFSIYLVHLLAINIVYDKIEHLIPSANANVVVVSMILRSCQ